MKAKLSALALLATLTRLAAAEGYTLLAQEQMPPVPQTQAQTQPENHTAQSCTAIGDAAARLACFDKAFSTQGQNAPVSKSIDLGGTIAASKSEQAATIVFAEPAPAAEAYTPLSQQYDLDSNNPSGTFSIREHEPMYLLPAWYRTTPNYAPSSPTRGIATDDVQSQQKHIETKMQISLKTKVMEDLFGARADLWAGYTQQSNWQVYNRGKKSAPFRNSDYMPEIFITQPIRANLPFGGRLRMLGAGYVHQSNGRSRPMSRSWNRIYAMAGMEWNKLTVVPRLWVRLDPDGDKDDNPDITDYMGYGDLRIAYRFDNRHSLSSLLRYNPKTGKGAVQMNYTFPIKGKLKGYVQGFYGYGESLLDYNHKQKALGLGILFNDWDAL